MNLFNTRGLNGARFSQGSDLHACAERRRYLDRKQRRIDRRLERIIRRVAQMISVHPPPKVDPAVGPFRPMPPFVHLCYFSPSPLAVSHRVGHIQPTGAVAEWLKAAVC
ncbi:hypothetical protein [uncultured Bradyrhizobium sp.]|uniref:hypothetical protein n=1 Tax=uncultured Bradyrhizobium sp. TaxID=199684 RepID=UPI0035CAD284